MDNHTSDISASKDSADPASHLLQEEVFKNSANCVLPSITITPPESNNSPSVSTTDMEMGFEALGDRYYCQDTTKFIQFSPISFSEVFDLDQSRSDSYDLQNSAVELNQIFSTVEGISPENQNPPVTNQNPPEANQNLPVINQNSSEKSKSSVELLHIGNDVPQIYKQQLAPIKICTESFRTYSVKETDSSDTVHQKEKLSEIDKTEIKELHVEIIQIPVIKKIPDRGAKSRSKFKSKAKSSLPRPEGGIKFYPYLDNGGGSSRSLLKTKSGVQSSHPQSSENKSAFSKKGQEITDTNKAIVDELGSIPQKAKRTESTNKAEVLFRNTNSNDTENCKAVASGTSGNKTNQSSECELSAHCQSLETESVISVDENRLSDCDRDFLDTLSKHY